MSVSQGPVSQGPVSQGPVSQGPVFDVVICHGPHDNPILKQNILHTRRNVRGFRQIYIITHDRALKAVPGCRVYHESIFPFQMADIAAYIKATNGRQGWYLQQLLKLYAGQVLPDLAAYYLVIDCDTLFLKPTHFFSKGGMPLYNVGQEYHLPYFQQMQRLIPGLTKQIKGSGICHHMLFSTAVLGDMFRKVVEKEKEGSNAKEFWRAFLQAVEPSLYNKSGASEYELYLNYLVKYKPGQYKIRLLPWQNGLRGMQSGAMQSGAMQSGGMQRGADYAYSSQHWHERGNKPRWGINLK